MSSSLIYELGKAFVGLFPPPSQMHEYKYEILGEFVAVTLFMAIKWHRGTATHPVTLAFAIAALAAAVFTTYTIAVINAFLFLLILALPSRSDMVVWFDLPSLMVNATFLMRRGARAALGLSFTETREYTASPSSLAMRDGAPILEFDGDSIVLVGDVGEGYDPTYAVAKLIDSRDPEALFLLGDLSYPQFDASNSSRLTRPYSKIHQRERGGPIATYLAVGNHDFIDEYQQFFRTLDGHLSLGERFSIENETTSYIVHIPQHSVAIIVAHFDETDDACCPDVDALLLALEEMPADTNLVLTGHRPFWLLDLKAGEAPHLDRLLEAVRERLVLVIGGDLHNFSVHEYPGHESPLFVVTGGGGAHMHPTFVDRRGRVPKLNGNVQMRQTYAYPDPKASGSLRLTYKFALLAVMQPSATLLLTVLVTLLSLFRLGESGQLFTYTSLGWDILRLLELLALFGATSALGSAAIRGLERVGDHLNIDRLNVRTLCKLVLYIAIFLFFLAAPWSMARLRTLDLENALRVTASLVTLGGIAITLLVPFILSRHHSVSTMLSIESLFAAIRSTSHKSILDLRLTSDGIDLAAFVLDTPSSPLPVSPTWAARVPWKNLRPRRKRRVRGDA
jgi:hypothetical protein